MSVPAVRRRVATVMVAAAMAWPIPDEPAVASCAGPSLSLAGAVGGVRSAPVVISDGPIVVGGRGFVDGCDDQVGGSSWGRQASEAEVETPLAGVDLVVRQGGRTWGLGSADAGTGEDGRMGQIVWRVTLPSALEPGRAVLVVGEFTRLPVEVVASMR